MVKISAPPPSFVAMDKDAKVLKIVLQFVPEKNDEKSRQAAAASAVAYNNGVHILKTVGLAAEDPPKKEMGSAWRVISFFVVVFILPTILISVPLYARYHVYQAKTVFFTDGDMRSLHSEVSSFWCQGQRILGNGSFEAYLTKSEKVHRRKSRNTLLHSEVLLTEDDAEEWGIYLIKGSSFSFSTCSRWPGGGLTVVKGGENLKKCFYREDRVKRVLTNGEQRRARRGVRRPPISEDYEENGGIGVEVFDEQNPHDDEQITRKIYSKTTPTTSHPGKGSGKYSKPKLNNRRRNSKDRLKNEPKTPIPFTYPEAHRNYRADEAFYRDYQTKLYSKLSTPSQKLHFHMYRDGDFVSVPWNDTFDVTAGNSSYSSSEEYLSQCLDTLFSIELMPYIDCSNMAHLSKHTNNITWHLTINESDYYYFIFTSDNSIERNTISFDLFIRRKLYNVSDPVEKCSNATECVFPLAFMRSDGVIVDYNGRTDELFAMEDLTTYRMTYTCQPRSVVYTVLIMLVPFVIILFAFR